MIAIKKTLIGIPVFFLVIISLFLGAFLVTAIPTKGKKIEKYAHPRKALLVIDIQEDFTGTAASPSSPYLKPDPAKFIASVNNVIAKAEKKGMTIVYIRQEFVGPWGRLVSKILFGGTAIKGNPGTEIDKRVSVISENVFPKPSGDAFSNPELDAFMIKNKVDELYLTGLDAEYCVHATAQGALNRGYKVNIVTDAILLGAVKKWDQMMKKYRQEGINLMTGREL